MGFNPLKLLGGAAKVLGQAFGIDLSAVTDALESGNLSPEQRSALMSHEVELKQLALEEMQTEIDAKVSVITAELQQEDKYVKRARPTGMYIFYTVSLIVTVAMITGWEPDTGALTVILTPLAGYGGWYTYQRSQDKKNGAAS